MTGVPKVQLPTQGSPCRDHPSEAASCWLRGARLMMSADWGNSRLDLLTASSSCFDPLRGITNFLASPEREDLGRESWVRLSLNRSPLLYRRGQGSRSATLTVTFFIRLIV
jgi:hypothetical protein